MNRHAHRLALGLLGAVIAGCEAQTGPAPICGDVPEAKGWRAEVLVGGLSHPWSIAWLPDGSALGSGRDGRLRRVRDGKLDPVPMAGLAPVLAAGQGGLLDVCLHPDFATTSSSTAVGALKTPAPASPMAFIRARSRNSATTRGPIPIRWNQDPGPGAGRCCRWAWAWARPPG